MRADIKLNSEKAEFLAGTLGPETSRDIPRTKVEVIVKDNELVLRLTAEDVTALRAAMNSYLRWLKLALETEETVGGM